MLLPLRDGIEAVRQLAFRLHGVLSQPYEVQGHRVEAPASIGIALAPAHGRSDDELRRHADAALYRAKAHRERAFFIFELETPAPPLDRAA